MQCANGDVQIQWQLLTLIEGRQRFSEPELHTSAHYSRLTVYRR